MNKADWLKSEIEKLEGGGEICCECNGDGWVCGSEAGHGCNGTDEDCAITCPIQIQTQEGCDMCGGTGKIIHPDVTSIITRYKEELLELEKEV